MAKADRPDHEIHAHYKGKMKRWVFGVLWAAFLAYALVLLPEELVSALEKIIGPLAANIVTVASGSALGPLLAIVLFSSDSAVNGNNKTAIWVRSIYPSTACVKLTSYTPDESRTLWFRYFDTWALPSSPNQALLQNTYSATYTARLVYHLTTACGFLFLLSVTTIVVNHWVLNSYATPKNAWPHVLVAALYAAGWVWLYFGNRPGSDSSEPTGAWKRVAEVFGRSVVLFKLEVLEGTSSLKEAIERVDEIRTKSSTLPVSNGK